MAAYIIEIPNPFEPYKDIRRHQVTDKLSIREWLLSEYPGFIEFDLPTVCVMNGQPILRSLWSETIIEDGDIVNFITMPKGWFAVIAVLIVALVVILTLVFQPDIPTPGELPASDPVFSTKGQGNEIRLGEPIEVCYGRNRMYPAFASRPYFQYFHNDQFQFSLYCLGQGEYEIEQLLIGDTDIDDFQEVTYEVLPPGTPATLFPISVVTSVEAGGQTLFGPNEAEYVASGWVGPFPTNPAGTTTTKIEIDVSMPKGIYSVTKKGKLELRSVQIQWQAREIDDLGDPLGDWVDLFSPIVKVIPGATVTPQRRTFSATVASGRYEARLRRTNNKDKSHKSGNEGVWEALRAFIEEEQDFGDVTIIAVKIRASNNLNNRSQLKFNVIATRKLPIYAPDDTGTIDGWLPPTPTRSIVWAFADVFRAKYGGRVFDDGYIDLDALLALDDFYALRNEHFDWIFRDPMTVWEAARTIARAGRGTPLIAGSIITLKRDGPLEVPVTLFSPENMIKGTFKWAVKLFDVEEFDSVSIEYTEVSTGYKQEQVLCTLPGGTTDNPRDVRLVGVQDRDHAYHEGLFLLATERYVRESVTFETGMEGHLPAYGDLIAVAHDMPRWGQYGYIVALIGSVGDERDLLVSEPMNFEDTGEHVVMLRSKNGELIGPFTATAGPNSKRITIVLDSTGEPEFLLSGLTEPMLFVFGVLGNITKYTKVTKIEHAGGERVSLTAVNYEAVLHSFDELEAPGLNDSPAPPEPPDLPTISNLYVTQIDDVQHIIQVAWTSAFGAQYYVVETSEDDGENWNPKGITVHTSILIQSRPGDLKVRVAAVNNGQGPWIEEDFFVGVVSGIDLEQEWDDVWWQIGWWQVLNAYEYEVKVYNNMDPLVPVLERTETFPNNEQTSYVYDYDKAVADANLVRNMLVTVDAVFADGASGFPASLEIENAIPAPPFNLSQSIVDTQPTFLTYELVWEVPVEEDLITVKVWVSPTINFDPEIEVPVWEYTHTEPGADTIPVSTEVDVALVAGAHPIQYWRVALFDVWGNEISTNISAQETIPAYP